MKRILLLAIPLALLFVSCVSTPANVPLYKSNAIEERGERTIISDIQLVGEAQIGKNAIGVFFSRETHQTGQAENILFVIRTLNTRQTGLAAYELGNAASISISQAEKLIKALDQYIATNPKDIGKDKLLNFELYAGLLNMNKDSSYRQLTDITFALIYAITDKAKLFLTRLPYAYMDKTGLTYFNTTNIELDDTQVNNLRVVLVKAVALKSASSVETKTKI